MGQGTALTAGGCRCAVHAVDCVHDKRIKGSVIIVGAALLGTLSPASADAGGVTLTDIAGPETGLLYARVASPRNTVLDALKAQPFIIVPDAIAEGPLKGRGSPGVAILDYDRDGDLDLYVTNGPGAPNSLFSNQLVETGALTFTDVGIAAGVDATTQDSNGVCFGDIDNDGDHDLYVLGTEEQNRLFENNGDGTFEDITELSEVGGDDKNAWECTMGDVDGDGLLDIFVGNSYSDPQMQVGSLFEPYAFNQHNNLFINQGDGVFLDETVSRGLHEVANFPPSTADATISAAMVDYDMDGDIDILTGGDQGGFPLTAFGGADRGYIHIYQNDGHGDFVDVMTTAGTDQVGGWMGFSFGDLNADGNLDFFATNFGDYANQLFPFPIPQGLFSSRWFLSNGDGTFSDPGQGGLGPVSPFGWGTSMADYDNDGDTDIVYHGGLDLITHLESSNPGSILENQGASATFTLDTAALAGSVDHTRRNVHGVAMGDLNQDGFADIVSVSNQDFPEPNLLVPYAAEGSVWDATAFFTPAFFPNPADPTMFFPNPGLVLDEGSLAVEVSDGANGNHWAEISTLGTVGITPNGVSNRDGIGAIVTFHRYGSPAAMQPVLGGSSFASQDSLAITFGMEDDWFGVVDVVWPGGARNRLYGVGHSERIVFPEIGCDVDGAWQNFGKYAKCVNKSLRKLKKKGHISQQQRSRFFVSALWAFFD